MSADVIFWRRVDVESFERLELSVEPEGVTVISTVLSLADGGFRLDHRWRLDAEWRAQFVTVDRWNSRGHQMLTLERVGRGWRVDGRARPDLDGAEEPDLSVTPFCNTLPIRRTPPTPGESLTIDTAFIHGPTLTVARSRQRYIRRGPRMLRYVDLGISRGFESDLLVDDSGVVLRYEHLFHRVEPDAAEKMDVPHPG